MIIFQPIGVVHTPFQKVEETPIQSSRSDAAGTVEVYPEFLEGLDGIEEFSHIYLLYDLNQAPKGSPLKVTPFLDDQLHGIFATRFPNRPNSLGLSVVRLIARKENILDILGVDMLDGTPLLDIKPYLPDFDIHPVTKIGWYARRAHP
jgi:tRNA (adenine37-N6)-methyltransferase